jgi:hypothetical protein
MYTELVNASCFFLFILGVMMASTSNAEGVLPCSADVVPIQIMNEARGQPEVISSIDKISSGSTDFRAFVTAVTAHITARLDKDKLCLNSADSKNRPLLQFVNWPLFMLYDFRVPVLHGTPWYRSSDGCLIHSPWIDIAIERKPVPWIRAVVRWNERQLLADQAVLAGAKYVPPGVAMPLMNSQLGYFINNYEDTMRRGGLLMARRERHERNPKEEDTTELERLEREWAAEQPIEERIPPDILWLLRRTGFRLGNGKVVFIAIVDSQLRRVTAKGAENYTKLVNALIDRCFASDRAYLRYNNILDVADLIPLEQYKIETQIAY